MRFATSNSKARELLMTVDDYSGGTNSLIDQVRMPSKFAVESVNMIQVQDGLWKTRWGTKYYGADYGVNPDGACEYVKEDGTTESVVIANSKAYKSIDGGVATELSGATFTAGLTCYFTQMGGYDTTTGVAKSYLYIANGTDPLARYDGTSLTTYTQISAPTNLVASLVASGLTSGTYTYYAQVTALNTVGETVGSTEASITVNKDRDNWIVGTDKVAWSWTASAEAKRYQLYLSDQSGYETLLADTEVTNFTDDGSADLNPYVEVPDDNTTSAPRFKSMCVSNNRIFATNDPNNLYKVYFSGTGRQIGTFSDFYGGGWVSLERGGREIPIAVKHYQSGQGSGMATVLCKTPDGKGAVWQIDIIALTVGDTSFSVPSSTKVVGSFGTESLNGVIATTNNIEFPNRKGWFSLGPEKNYYGILRTNEMSSNIRPYWRSLVGSGIDDICAYFYDAKIFISVATATGGNNRIIVRDTERNNWAVDWTMGAKQFLEYTDTNQETHFLFIPNSGTRLVELSEYFLNDLGTAFNQSYISPLFSVSKNQTDIFNLRHAIVKLGNPRGSINFQILGIGKDGSFSTISSKTIINFGSDTGIGSDLAGECYAGETSASVRGGADSWAIYLLEAPSTFTTAITPAAIKKRAKLYSLQFKVYSTTADTDFTLLSLQAKGTLIPRKLSNAWTN
jgi:hypothetical protein